MKKYRLEIVAKAKDKRKLTEELVQNLREVDRQEIEGLGFSTMQGVSVSIHETSPVYTARTADGKLIAVWGLQVLMGKTGKNTYLIWALATDEITHYEKSFVRESRALLNRWVELYGCLENTVATFNTRAIRWLRWLGAEFSEPHKIGNAEYMDFKLKKKGK